MNNVELFEYLEAIFETFRLLENPDRWEVKTMKTKCFRVSLLDINQDHMIKWWRSSLGPDWTVGSVANELHYMATYIMDEYEEIKRKRKLSIEELYYLQKAYFMFGYLQKCLGFLPGAVKFWRKMYTLPDSHWNWYYMRLDNWCIAM